MTPARPTAGLRDNSALEVYLLGTVDFESSLVLQQQLVDSLAQRRDGQGALLVCEHPPLITMGREGSLAHVHCDREELVARQIDVRWLNRGGGTLLHAPGQLAAYPLIPLQERGLGLAEYRRRLERAVIDVCAEFRVPAWSAPDAPGVWTRCGQVAHLGVAVRSWISYHGLYLNVCPPLDLLRLVCGQAATARVSSLAAERLRAIAMPSARGSLIRHLAAQLGYARYHIYTGHPLLRRTRRIVAYA